MGSSSITALKHSAKGPEGDEVYTPGLAISPLLHYVPKSKVIYEPTSNDSLAMVNFMRARGYQVLDSEGRDFLVDDLPEFDIIITNPPYSKKDAFIKRCYDIGKPFALLLPVTALQGNRRGQWFMEHGIQLLVLNQRIDFTGKGSPHFGVAWFCYNLLPDKLIFTNIK